MTTEQLMQPRRKVMIAYPFSRFRVGDILWYIPDGNPNHHPWWCTKPVFEPANCSLHNPNDIEMFPHIFQKLEWWQERKEEDLPEYIAFLDIVYKIDKWEIYLGTPIAAMTDKRAEDSFKVFSHFHITQMNPATEAEYLEYKNKTE